MEGGIEKTKPMIYLITEANKHQLTAAELDLGWQAYLAHPRIESWLAWHISIFAQMLRLPVGVEFWRWAAPKVAHGPCSSRAGRWGAWVCFRIGPKPERTEVGLRWRRLRHGPKGQHPQAEVAALALGDGLRGSPKRGADEA